MVRAWNRDGCRDLGGTVVGAVAFVKRHESSIGRLRRAMDGLAADMNEGRWYAVAQAHKAVWLYSTRDPKPPFYLRLKSGHFNAFGRSGRTHALP